MKTYIIASNTNYGLMTHIVNAESKERAWELANKHITQPWSNASIMELPKDVEGVVAYFDDTV